MYCHQSISPGRTATEFAKAAGRVGDPETFYKDSAHLTAQDIVDSIVYALSAPPHVQVMKHNHRYTSIPLFLIHHQL